MLTAVKQALCDSGQPADKGEFGQMLEGVGNKYVMVIFIRKVAWQEK